MEGKAAKDHDKMFQSKLVAIFRGIVDDQSQKTQGFCVANFATQSDEKDRVRKWFYCLIREENLALENLKSSHVRKFLLFCKLMMYQHNTMETSSS